MDSIINVSAIQNIVYIGSSILFIFGIKNSVYTILLHLKLKNELELTIGVN